MYIVSLDTNTWLFQKNISIVSFDVYMGVYTEAWLTVSNASAPQCTVSNACTKIQASFAAYSLSYSALLRKRPIILRSLPIVAIGYCVECHRASVYCVHWQYATQQIGMHSQKYKSLLQNIGSFDRTLLQKRPIILRSLLIVAIGYCIHCQRASVYYVQRRKITGLFCRISSLV